MADPKDAVVDTTKLGNVIKSYRDSIYNDIKPKCNNDNMTVEDLQKALSQLPPTANVVNVSSNSITSKIGIDKNKTSESDITISSLPLVDICKCLINRLASSQLIAENMGDYYLANEIADIIATTRATITKLNEIVNELQSKKESNMRSFKHNV